MDNLYYPKVVYLIKKHLMKKAFTLFMISLVTLSIKAQIEKGTMSLGGGALIQKQWSEEAGRNGHNIGLNPSASFMLSDRLLVGGAIGTGVFSNNGNSDWGNFFQPEIRYYLTPQAAKNKYFIGAVGGFDITEFGDATYGFNAGLNRFVNESIALEAIASYQFVREVPNPFTLSLNFRSFISKEARAEWKKNGIRTFQRGDWLVGRSIAEINFIADQFVLNLSPLAAYFLNERLAVGAEINAFTSLNDNNSFAQFSGLTFTPFTRLYLTDAKRWRWFAEAGISYVRTTGRVEDAFTSINYSFSTRGRVGANVFLTQNLALELFMEGNYYFGTNLNVDYVEPTIITPGSPFPREDFKSFLSDRRFELSGGVALRFFIGGKK